MKSLYWYLILLLVGLACLLFGAIPFLKKWTDFIQKWHRHGFVVFGLVCLLSASYHLYFEKDAKDPKCDPNVPTDFDNHEKQSPCFYTAANRKLKQNEDNKKEVEQLERVLDAQLKLEDFLIKFRAAEHAKLEVWGTLFISGIVSLIVAVLVLLGNTVWKGGA